MIDIELANELAKKARQFTIHLFHDEARNAPKPTPWGSAVLFRDNDRHFLLTAGHVYKNRNPLDIGTYIQGHDFVFFGGTSPRLLEPNGLRADGEENYIPSNMDLAIIQLDDETTKELSRIYSFLDYKDFSLEPAPRLTSYLIFGYPKSRTVEMPESKTFDRQPFVFGSHEMGDQCYTHHRMNRTKSLIILGGLHKVYRAATRNTELLPDLGGISGCGVWGIASGKGNEIYPTLHSIITGGHNKGEILFSTRVANISKYLTESLNNHIK